MIQTIFFFQFLERNQKNNYLEKEKHHDIWVSCEKNSLKSKINLLIFSIFCQTIKSTSICLHICFLCRSKLWKLHVHFLSWNFQVYHIWQKIHRELPDPISLYQPPSQKPNNKYVYLFWLWKINHQFTLCSLYSTSL